MRQWGDYEPSGSSAGGPGQTRDGSWPQLLRAGPRLRRRRTWVGRHKFFSVVAAIGAMVCGAGVASAAQSPKPAGGQVTVTSAAAAARCAVQVRAWANGGAVGLIGSFSRDLGAFATAAQAFTANLGAGEVAAGAVPEIRSAAAAIRSTARGVAANPGPPCVPGLRGNLAAAAGDYATAAAYADHGMSRYIAGDVNGAVWDITAAGSALANGSVGLARATAALSGYRASQG